MFAQTISHNLIFFILLSLQSDGTTQCPESNRTATFVDSCPESAEKRAEAASQLNCQNIKHKCTSFVYHCVMNHNRTNVIEVCAPVTNILGNYGVLNLQSSCFLIMFNSWKNKDERKFDKIWYTHSQVYL